MNNIRYASIRSLDVSNGENVGVSLFVQGCPFNPHCHNCFNPETWDFNGGKEWTEEVENKFIELVARPYIKRISILGGEPLADENLDGVLNLVNKILLSFGDTKTIWLYTGYQAQIKQDRVNVDDFWNDEDESYSYISFTPISGTPYDFIRSVIASKIDILVDGKYIDSQRDLSLRWRGSINQRIIDIKQSLKKEKIIIYGDD